ncbi:DUF5615 family PIN-like protein [Bradyrhizobium sp. CNPSo 4010]|uniref:DUF5615 family PIN-like protein n=1 Tax=Bradyrhizobium agreste TaxID=2751811 RepID=A0ABS0PLQ7_9BRAD|nr:DUF5615 family PIN-like protein [Bradyrhizobium agreste]MBH5398143.1 DUF5615 family PIN-like protein [Bradyrhizobium agreste]
MLWLADECVSVSLVRELRGAGHDVLYIAEFAASMSDVEVIALASLHRGPASGRAGSGATPPPHSPHASASASAPSPAPGPGISPYSSAAP